MSVKQNIRRIIEADPDLTVRNVSLKAGMSDSALHKFLTKPGHSMSVDNLQEVAKVIGVDVRELFDTEEDAPRRRGYRLFTEAEIEMMVRNAMLEIQPGMTLGEIERVASSALHEQIERLQSDAARPDRPAQGHVHSTDAQSRVPTNADVPAK